MPILRALLTENPAWESACAHIPDFKRRFSDESLFNHIIACRGAFLKRLRQYG